VAVSIMVQGSLSPVVLATAWPAASMEAAAGTAKAEEKERAGEIRPSACAMVEFALIAQGRRLDR
jgi:hypothetical protein